MDLVKPELVTQLKNELHENGFIIIKNFFNKEYINTLRNKAEEVFKIQFNKYGYTGDFTENMIKLFQNHEEVFINCGKIIQSGLIELYLA